MILIHSSDSYPFVVGVVSLFRHQQSTWTMTQQIPFQSSDYRLTVSLTTEHLAVGVAATVSGSDSGSGSGVVYMYRKNADDIWVRTQVLAPLSRSPGNLFGGRTSYLFP